MGMATSTHPSLAIGFVCAHRVPCTMRRSLALFILCAACPFLLAQERSFVDTPAARAPLFTARLLTTRDGLPHRIVHSIAQDERGFIWLGTPAGLVRFDGHAMMTLTSAEGLASDAVRTVVCDAQGSLWVHHTNGTLEIVDPISLKVHSLPDRLGALPPEAHGAVTSLIATAQRTIVFAQNGHLFWTRDARSGLNALRVPCGGRVDLLRNAPEEQVWCACHTRAGAEFPVQLIRYALGQAPGDPTAHRTEQLPDTVATVCVQGRDEYPHRPKEAPGTYVLVHANNTLHNWWVPLNDHPDRDMGWNGRDMMPTDVNDLIRAPLTEDLWLVNMTVRRMHAGDDPFAAPVVLDLASIIPQAGMGQLDLLRDRMGTVWIAGEFGLIHLGMRPDRFHRYLWNGSTQHLGENRVRGMLVLGTDLHVNTETTGYWVLDAGSGSTKSHAEQKTFRAGIISDGNGGLWRSRLSEMLHQGPDGRVDRIIKAGDRSYDAWTGVLLDNGTLLIGSIKGIRSADRVDTSFHFVPTGNADLDQAWIAQLIKSGKDRVLACTNAGLFELDADGRVIERWWTGAAEGDPHRFPTDDIRYAFSDTAGMYWLGTGSQGLLRWDRAHGLTRVIGRTQGLPTVSIHAIHPDRRGMLWMPTDNGLVRYDPPTGQVKVYTTADGLGFDEFNRLAHAQGPDGRLYFGGLNGITAFHPDDLGEPAEVTTGPLVLKSIRVQREEGDAMQDLTVDVLEGAPVLMRPKDRFISVDLALLTYEDPALLEYAWRIDGIDVDWNLQREPFLRITALPYGDHLLRLKAQDAEGRWSEEIRIPLTMMKPVHLRWWFLLLCLLALGAIVYAIVRYRERQLRQVIRIRDRIALDLHDEVGSNLSSVVLFSTAVGKHADALPPEAMAMLKRMKENSRRAMESMNDIVWSVNSGHDSMVDLVDRFQAFAQPVCEAADIDVRFHVVDGVLDRRLGMEQRKNIYLIFKEAVNNAVKHGQCHRIDVHVRAAGHMLELEVTDDGIGLGATDAQKAGLGGNGIDNMQRRAAQIGGTLEVTSGAQRGTTVRLRAPL